jgi:hypothetical protein
MYDFLDKLSLVTAQALSHQTESQWLTLKKGWVYYIGLGLTKGETPTSNGHGLMIIALGMAA